MSSFLNSAGSILNLSVPLITRPHFYIRLHFWLLLSYLYVIIGNVQSGQPRFYIPIDIALITAVLLVHEFGHRVMARTVGGDHWEFVLWPLGGMMPPHAPRTPWATFVAHTGGILFTIPLAAGSLIALYFLRFPFFDLTQNLNTLAPAGVVTLDVLNHVLRLIAASSVSLILINLFPAYWFDGGYILQSMLQPKLGLYRAISITCIVGMVMAGLFFGLALAVRSIFTMIFWGLIFWDCLSRRRAVLAAGPGGMGDEDYSEYNYMDTGRKPRRAVKRGWFKTAKRKADAERAEQAKIDAILTKVHERGLHSLSWWEKRTLRKATERQRQRDLAERL